MKTKLIALMSAVASMAWMVACSEQAAPRRTGAQTPAVAAKPVVQTELSSGEKVGDEPVFVYSYNPSGKRDPFRSYTATMGAAGEEESLSALQKFSVDQLKVTGILWGISNPKALIVDPEGFGHVIEKGTFIGRNWGKVTRIGKTDVVVAEEYRDPLGKLIINEISMRLQRENEQQTK